MYDVNSFKTPLEQLQQLHCSWNACLVFCAATGFSIADALLAGNAVVLPRAFTDESIEVRRESK